MTNRLNLSTRKQYQTTSAFGHLMEKHKLDEEGIWQVYGEDPNCDMGGSHIQPYLGLFSGKLVDVLNYAVELPDFWQWGAGGDIKKLGAPVHITADSVRERSLDMEQIARMTTELENLKRKHGIM
jgi:hypothetical protein